MNMEIINFYLRVLVCILCAIEIFIVRRSKRVLTGILIILFSMIHAVMIKDELDMILILILTALQGGIVGQALFTNQVNLLKEGAI